MENTPLTQPDVADVFLYFGTASVFSGFFLIYPPLGYLAAGLIFLFISWSLANPRPRVIVKEAK